ncbi:MAG: TOBE domain-containing protein [Pseudomonadota bacterium]
MLNAVVDLVQPTGTRVYIQFQLAGQEVTAELPAHDVERAGTPVDLAVDMGRIVLIDPSSGRVLPLGP